MNAQEILRDETFELICSDKVKKIHYQEYDKYLHQFWSEKQWLVLRYSQMVTEDPR